MKSIISSVNDTSKFRSNTLRLLTWAGWIILLISITSIFIVNIFLLRTPFQVYCVFNGHTCPDPIYTELRKSVSGGILSINRSQIQSQLLRNYPMLNENINLSLKFPHTLTVDLSTKPVSVLITHPAQITPVAYALDGTLIPDYSSNNPLPLLHFLYPPTVDSRQNFVLNQDINSIALIEQALNIGFTFTFAKSLSAYELHATQDNKVWAVLNPQLDHTRQLTTLQIILSQATMKPELPVIDVRFSQPVLKPLSALGAVEEGKF